MKKFVYITTNAAITWSILGEKSRRKIDKVISVYCIMTNVIYSVSCKDASTNYTYIDYTKNVSKIKYFHKHNSTVHPGVFYETIRNNGGWDNWNFTILETCDNMDIQMKIKTYKSVLENTNVDINLHCDVCQYSCRKRSDYDKHCNSIKHKQRLSITRANDDITTLTSLVKEVLLSNQEIHKSSVEMQQQFMNEIVKSNQELQQQVVELSNKQPVQQITNVVQQNTQNNSFNIQVFLNETCGEAYNLSDILKSMVITNEDLVYNTQVGFVKGMTAIFKREMCDKIPLVKRPLHCTDLKRETVFYRENNVWHKEEGKTVEEDIMFQLTRSCLRTYLEWRKVHPDAENMRSEFNTLCDKIQVSVMPGYEKDKLYPKTMTEIYKHCLIDKKNMR